MDFNHELLKIVQAKRFVKKLNAETWLTRAQAEKRSVLELLVSEGMLSERQMLTALGEYYGMATTEVDMLERDKQTAEKYSYAFIKKHNVLPVSVDDDGVLLAAVSNPADMHAMSAVTALHGGKVEFILVRESQIQHFVTSAMAQRSTSLALSDLQKEKQKPARRAAPTATTQQTEEPDDTVINAPAVRLVDSFIREAIPFRASDIHIEPFEKAVKVRYRIDGELQERAEFPLTFYAAVCARLKIMAGINIAERRIPQDGRINLTIDGNEVDMRISTLPTVHGEKFVIRILDKTSFGFARAELGFTDAENKIVDRMLAKPHGILLVTGPTGCGKSTTLYSFIKEINRPGVNIVTVEDPVEYTLHGINQTQVNAKAKLTFATVLRSILRQDPNIIMIGEIRDEETAQIATRAAITGHLVFSTLHTNDAPGTVSRLVDMGIKPYLLADSLVGAIAQRLVKRLCPACKKASRTTKEETEFLGLDSPKRIFRPQGCNYCGQSGYRGRIGVHEVMENTAELREVISRRSDSEAIYEAAKQGGMRTLLENGIQYLLDGITSIDEIKTLDSGIQITE